MMRDKTTNIILQLQNRLAEAEEKKEQIEMVLEELEDDERKEYERKIKQINDEISQLTEQEERMYQVEQVLNELIKAEQIACALERHSQSESAYDLWHLLRSATATLTAVIYPRTS